ncbi:hypothetical protein [Microbispora sp. H10830]|uniref:hypothetical protein n=1 Tax=Microbispora sp. H10830 TaxID=2729109 RepID=UPI002175B889|nr:hypothetical protein [Microbispora sp. H10830]
MSTSPVSLDDKYAAEHGTVLISGVQALVRLTLEQRRLDAARGLDTRVFVSGYPGSPLGGVDLEMARAARFLEEAGVVARPGLNEELAATAVAGTQLLAQVPGRRHEGVTGFWYGKNPGLDRAADAIRHGNLAGTAPLGGAVAWIGDDPGSKSSTVPSSCEPMCQSLSMPLLAPGSVAEVVELGLHAVALSRATGLWAGLKIVADVADATATVDLGPLHENVRSGVPVPDRADRGAPPTLVGPASLEAEHDMLTRRLGLAREYARAHGLNRVTHDAPRATTGVLASGTSYAVVLRALADLGLDEAAMDHLGLRLIRLAMPFPLAYDDLAAMTAGLGRVLVVEDKVPFLEGHLKQALYDTGQRPDVIGRELLTSRGTLGAEDVASALATCLGGDRLPRQAAILSPAPSATRAKRRTLPLVAARTPYFCSGCPHNASTRASDDTLVGAGIGCHAMIALDGNGRGRQVGMTQMGGRRRPVVRPGPLHLRPSLHPEPRRRHLPPLRLAGRTRRRRGRRLDDVQAALQRRGRDDRRAARRGPPRRPGADAVAGGRGGAPGGGDHAGAGDLPRCPAGADRIRAAPRRPPGRGEGTRRGRRGDRADPRRPLRGRGATAAQARQAARGAGQSGGQRARVRGLRRLRGHLHLPVRAAGGDRVRPQDPHPPGVVQLRPELPQGRLPVVPARRASRRDPS